MISCELQQSVLARALELAREAGRSGVAVFDLDSTLCDNRPRQARILREYGAARGIAQLAGARPEHWTSWSVTTALRNAGLTDAEARALAHDARAFWRERFFTSEYCADDDAIAGAAEYLAALGQTGCRIAYVTGRHVGMEAGTLASFRRVGFPLPDADRVHLRLKPVFEMSDDDWKRRVAPDLSALGRVLCAFDNEPAHVNIYRAAHPDALVVHLATDHSGRPIPLAEGVSVIADFVCA